MTDLNSYPYLDTKSKPVFSARLADITPRCIPEKVIDISGSSLVAASDLRVKLKMLQAAGQLDGGLPVVRDGILVGLIPAPDLEYALDSLNQEEDEFCLMAPRDEYSVTSEDEVSVKDPTDFTPYIDPAPMSLEKNSPMDLVWECFAKLGLRYLCVLGNGKFAGVVCCACNACNAGRHHSNIPTGSQESVCEIFKGRKRRQSLLIDIISSWWEYWV